MTPTSRTFVWFGVFLTLLVTAFLLPRLAAGNETGLAAGATAALAFLGCIGAAGVIGIVLLILTVRHRATLPLGAKLAGFLPLPLLAATVIVVILLALDAQRRRQQAEPPPRALTPTAPAASP